MTELKTITPTELLAIAGTRPVRLIDVRTPAEFARGHARGAENIPARRLDAATFATLPEPIYLICRGGTRATEVCERLATEAPAVRAVVVEGGTLAWEAAGLPVERPTDWRKFRRWLHRVGGALAILSVLLAIFVHRGLIGLVGIVGAVVVAYELFIFQYVDRADRPTGD